MNKALLIILIVILAACTLPSDDLTPTPSNGTQNPTMTLTAPPTANCQATNAAIPEVDICATASPPEAATLTLAARTWTPFATPTQEVFPDCTFLVDVLIVRVTSLNIRIDHTTNSERVSGVGLGEAVIVTACEPVIDDNHAWRQIAVGAFEGTWIASGTEQNPTEYLSK